MCEDGAGKAAGPRLVRVRIPEGSFRGVDIGSVPPWRDGKREALAPIRQPRASSRGVDAVVSAPGELTINLLIASSRLINHHAIS